MEFEKIQKIIADVLNIEPEKITMESAFVDDLNADSLDVLQIVMELKMSLTLRFLMKQQRRLLLLQMQ